MQSMAMMMDDVQDYETAAQALQLASTDFKAERAWKHYAGCQVQLQGSSAHAN
jgi:ER-Golgi trafficking TRAPP I complex 85 kDa subunit